jgi:serine/threonine protein kinase
LILENGKNLKLDLTKLSNHSLSAAKEPISTVVTATGASQNDKFYFNGVTRAHGTSNCPHTAKVDIRRVRSFTDLTQKQAIFYEEEFEFKEKLGEGFFANVKKCVCKRTGCEMVLKELKLNCVNLKKRGGGGGCDGEESGTSNGCSLDSCDSYEQQQPRIDLMINYAELNAAHKSFLKEAQVLRNLNHPNVIKFLGVMFAKERQFNLILEYIGGGTLKGI